LILADVFGATHTNLACRLLIRGHIELIGGVNLPMLLRTLNYRELPMDEIMDKALAGGCGGIVCASASDAKRETRA
jgi:PTS system ascorbate-specific IIA component